MGGWLDKTTANWKGGNNMILGKETRWLSKRQQNYECNSAVLTAEMGA